MKKIKSMDWLIKNQNIFLFLFAGLAVSVVGVILSYEPIFDSYIYFTDSQSFVNDASFSFLNYPASIRGYFFPFLLFLFSKFFGLFGLSALHSVTIASSFFMAAVFVKFLPEMVTSEKTKHSLISKIIILFLFMLFWSDLVYYPLSDLWAFGLCVIVLWTLLRVVKNKPSVFISSLIGLSVGVLLYGIYNIRTIYLFTYPIIILVFIASCIKRKISIQATIATVFFILLGSGICMIPQILINADHFRVCSPFVLTEKAGIDGNLFVFQLKNGIQVSRYETLFIGENGSDYKGYFAFYDKAGRYLLTEWESARLTGVVQYLQFFGRHFFDFVGVYMRHMINALHLPYNHVYIKQYYSLNNVFMLVNYSVCFFTGVGSVMYIKNKNGIKNIFNDDKYWLISTLLISSAILILGVIELRFFIPLYSIIYLVFSYLCIRKVFWNYVIKNAKVLVPLYIVILAVFISVWTNTLAYGDPTNLFLK